MGKTSIKFELQETTKDSKKKVYGPYKGCLEKDKIKVKMTGGRRKGHQVTANLNSYGNLPVYEEPYNSTPHGKKEFKVLRKIPNQHEIKIEFDKLYNQQKSDFESVKIKMNLKRNIFNIENLKPPIKTYLEDLLVVLIFGIHHRILKKES